MGVKVYFRLPTPTPLPTTNKKQIAHLDQRKSVVSILVIFILSIFFLKALLVLMLVYGFLDGFYFILIIWSRPICRILCGIQRIEMEGIPNEKMTKAKINRFLLKI